MDIALLIWSLALTIVVGVCIGWVFDLQSRLRRLQGSHEGVFAEGEEGAGVSAALENLAARLAKTNARTERLVARA